MKKNIRNCLGLALAWLICLAVALGFSLVRLNAIKDTPIRKKEMSEGTVNAVSILDVKGVMKMTAINYLPNEFAGMDTIVTDANTGEAPARRGTYRFYIDTLAIEEMDKAGELDRLLAPDGDWHLTMYIPPVFSACSIFVQYQIEEYIGSIDRYNVAYFISYSAPSEFDDSVVHESETQPLFIDIPISSDLKYSRECMVTIHMNRTTIILLGFRTKF